MKPASCRNIADLQEAAQHRLPRPIRFFLEGGAEDEVTLRGNAAAFNDYRLVPNVLRDMASVDISTEFLGRKVAMPLMLSPTGASEAFHPTAECAVSRAAARAGVIYTASCMSTRTLEDVAGVGEGPRIFQLYLLSDRGKISELIERARAAKYDALAITVDVVAHGNRERDLRTGFQVPPKLTLASWLNFALYPRWSLPAMRLKFQMANFPPAPNEDPKTMTARMFTRSFTWDDARWVVEQWGGPVLLKGVSSPADCQRAADIGIAGIMIGNHGGSTAMWHHSTSCRAFATRWETNSSWWSTAAFGGAPTWSRRSRSALTCVRSGGPISMGWPRSARRVWRARSRFSDRSSNAT
jgi:L-lactate dehydrogenase (cytochrome)